MPRQIRFHVPRPAMQHSETLAVYLLFQIFPTKHKKANNAENVLRVYELQHRLPDSHGNAQNFYNYPVSKENVKAGTKKSGRIYPFDFEIYYLCMLLVTNFKIEQ